MVSKQGTVVDVITVTLSALAAGTNHNYVLDATAVTLRLTGGGGG